MSKKIYYIILSIAAFIIPELCVYFPLNTELITLEKSVFYVTFGIYALLAAAFIIFGAKKVKDWNKLDILWSVLVIIAGIVLIIPIFFVLLFFRNIFSDAALMI